MKKNLPTILTLLLMIGSLFLLTGPLTEAKTFHVDIQARQPGNGSRAKPFQTLEQARDAVRKFTPKTEPVEILVGQGHYYLAKPFALTAEDSGTEQCPVTWRAVVPHSTFLCGGQVIPADRFKPVDNPIIRQRLDSTVQDKVLCVDLNALGVTKLSSLGTKMQMPLGVPELFFNGKRMKMASWPNEGWATIKKIVDKGSRANSGSAVDAANPDRQKTEPPRGGTFEYDGDRPSRWKTAENIWLHGYWCFDWYSEVLQIASIDPKKHEISLATQHVYGLRQGNPSPRRWMAVHLLEELDSPGEYYVDTKTRQLYFFPPESVKDATITIAWRYQPVVAMKNISHVTFRDFAIEDSYANLLTIEKSHHILIENCNFRNGRELGIIMAGGTNNTIRSCLVEQTGTGGIYVSGGNRKTLAPGHHLVDNNVIRSFSQHKLCYANGITLSGVGHTASHNELYDAPHQAVSLSGNDMIFEYNKVHNVCLTGDDCGALYKGRNPSARGNIIRYNYWYDIGSLRGHGNAAIYFDDGDGGEQVYGNVFYRTGEPGRGSFGSVFSHGGHGNRTENNIFIDCKRPLGSAPWNDKRWKGYIATQLWQTRLLKDVDITKPPYTEHYPELLGFMDGQPAEKRINIARKNVFVNCPMEKTGNWDVDDSNWKTDEDPGFIDMKGRNFQLRDNAEVFKKIPGFVPIPFDKIGPKGRNRE